MKAIEHMFVSQASSFLCGCPGQRPKGKTEGRGSSENPGPRLATANYFFFAAFLTFFTAFLTAFLTFFLAAIFLTSFY